jgi:hypothetical protein
MVSIVLFHNTESGLSGLFSNIIADAEDSPQRISHSALKVDVNGVPWILHAAWSGVAFIPMSEIMGNHSVVAEFEIVPDVSKEFEAAKGRVGQSYDVLTLLGYIFVVLGRYLHIGINNPMYSKSGEVCSELVIEMDVNHQIPEFEELVPADVTPQDLFNICSIGSSFRRLV